MPESLKRFLEGLDNGEANEIWTYFDSNKESVSDIIEVIADSHGDLNDILCGG